jgi:hypothetical protein
MREKRDDNLQQNKVSEHPEENIINEDDQFNLISIREI